MRDIYHFGFTWSIDGFLSLPVQFKALRVGMGH